MRKLVVFLWLITYSFHAAAQRDSSINNESNPANQLFITSISHGGILLDSNWKLHTGDNAEWAAPDYNDRHWNTLNLNQPASQFFAHTKGAICWLRLHLTLDIALQTTPLSLELFQFGNSEVYLDRQRIDHSSISPLKEVLPFNPNFGSTYHVLAIRFTCPMPRSAWAFKKAIVMPLRVKLQTTAGSIHDLQAEWEHAKLAFAIITVSAITSSFPVYSLVCLLPVDYWFYPYQFLTRSGRIVH